MHPTSPSHAQRLARSPARAPRSFRPSLFVLAAGMLGALGCAPEADDASNVSDSAYDADDAAPLPASEDAPVLAQQSTGKTLAGPNDSYFAEVTTNGSGCPAGSASTRISADGQVFTITFSQYEVSVNESTDISVRDCQISIRLHSPGGQSYAVHSFYYQGASVLDDGVNGTQTADYYFQGAPVTARSVRTELVGPRDKGYLFSDDVDTPQEYVWSPCGVDRDLQIFTRLQLQNTKPRRSGYMNLLAVDGSTRLEFQLAWKPCLPGTATNPPGTTATPPATSTPTPSTTPTQKPPQQPSNNNGLGTVVDGVGGVVGGVVDTLGGTVGGVLGGLGGLLGN